MSLASAIHSRNNKMCGERNEEFEGVNSSAIAGSHASSHGKGEEQSSLEAYAEAVRSYQDIVLELQSITLPNSELLGSLLEQAEAAKRRVNLHRNGFCGE